MKTAKSKLVVIAAAAALLVAGCGDDATDENKQAVEDSIRSTLEAQGASDEQIDCTVDEALGSISDEEFKAEDPPDDLGQRIADATLKCQDEAGGE